MQSIPFSSSSRSSVPSCNFNRLPFLWLGEVWQICCRDQSLLILWMWGGLRGGIHQVNAQPEKNYSHPCSSLALSPSVFVLRLLESSLINAEVKEGEILPPTIQKLMKGYNKYLRPFFDSKETADTSRNGNDRTLWGNVDLTEKKFILQFCACMSLLSNIGWHTYIWIYCTCITRWEEVKCIFFNIVTRKYCVCRRKKNIHIDLRPFNKYTYFSQIQQSILIVIISSNYDPIIFNYIY